MEQKKGYQLKPFEQKLLASLSWLVPLAVTLVAMTAMTKLGGMYPMPLGIALGVTLLQIALYVGATFGLLAQARKKPKLDQLLAEALQHKEKAKENLDRYYVSLRRKQYAFYAWIAFQIALSLLSVFLAEGVLKSDLTVAAMLITIPAILLSLFTLCSMLTWCMGIGHTPARRPDYTLKREQFPELYRVAEEVFADDKRSPILLWGDGINIGVAYENGVALIRIGAFALSWLTSEELRAVLWHERYHVDMDATGAEARIHRLLNSAAGPSKVATILVTGNALLIMPIVRVGKALTLSKTVTSALVETRADRYAAERGGASALASALVKLRLLCLYQDHDTDEPILYYASETAPTDWTQRMLQRFYTVLEERKAFWLSLIEKELPKRFGSHPSLPERLDEIGNPPYTVDAVEPDPAYAAERETIAAAFDRFLVRKNADTYASNRQIAYLRPMQTMEYYTARDAEGHAFTANELRPVIEACRTLERHELLLTLCDQAIAAAQNESAAAFAKMTKGQALLRRFDASGIELIRQAAAENYNFAEQANDAVLTFCIEMGMEEALEENRAFFLSLAQSMIDDGSREAGTLSKRDKLTAVPVLARETLDKDVAAIREICGERLLCIYCLTKNLSDSLSSTVFLIGFTPDAEEDEKNECLERVFYYLDSREEQYSLFDLPYAKSCGVDPEKFPGAKLYSKE